MYNKIGFIGSGNIAGAIIGGIIKKGFLSPENIYVSDIHKDKVDSLVNRYGVVGEKNNISLVEKCEVVILSVKPSAYESLIKEIKNNAKKDTLIITIAAGITIDYVKRSFGKDMKIIRTMPSIPALIGEGVTAVAYSTPVEGHDVEFVKDMFSSFGVVEVVEEPMMDAFTSVYSSTPAFIGMFIEAMVDAAEYLELPRENAYMLAAQAVKGAAEMVLKTGKHPEELKDMVCTPAGTAIEGVKYLEGQGVRSIIMKAVIVTAEKANMLSDKYK